VKTLWAALALSFPVLVVTGIVMWWNRVVTERWTADSQSIDSMRRG
jgi:uncharacterized iron-regulated membrane protein